MWAVAALPDSSVLEWEHQRIQLGGKGRGFLARSRNSGGIVGRPLLTKMGSRFPSFIPGHQRLSCLYQVISVLLFIPGHQRLLVYTRSPTSSCLRQVINVLFIPGHQRLLVYTRSSSDSLFIPGEASYSHQWPGCGERFLGQYNADKRFLGRLCEWLLGERDPRLGEGSGRRVVSSRPVPGISTTVGGRSARLMAAAPGGAASISSCASGQAARGWGSTRPGLKPPAILSSLCGSVNDLFPLKCPTGDPEKESR